MEAVIVTPRLKLTLLTNAERGSTEFGWLYELHTNEKSMFWSLGGPSKSLEDAEATMSCYLPTNKGDSRYRVAYAVHEIIDTAESATRFIGLVTLRSIDEGCLPLPEEFTIPVATSSTTLMLELAYTFLPIGWKKGYATESIKAILQSCKRKSSWAPFSKVYIRGIVNAENPASARVMEKIDMTYRGIYEWTGKAVFVGGKWRERDNIHVFGMYLLDVNTV